jgi:FAD/FMN-containing dehydrogenase
LARSIKQLLDPSSILNPGVIFEAQEREPAASS